MELASSSQPERLVAEVRRAGGVIPAPVEGESNARASPTGRETISGVPHGAVGVLLRVGGVRVSRRIPFFCNAQGTVVVDPGLNIRGDGTSVRADTPARIVASHVPRADGWYDAYARVARNNSQVVAVVEGWGNRFTPAEERLPEAELVPICT